ncbi:hypothetical protein O181_020324 [Austropuccinia psidii MF-1]|uniref:Uncharacterized protein n=1 Tax=Austropuccinia psidii MF-1 TaxID=1389203 RepID=A0A9Q3GVK7_9BASI|nr:hypothetical protein [Austropuccinia psidii MF-1]
MCICKHRKGAPIIPLKNSASFLRRVQTGTIAIRKSSSLSLEGFRRYHTAAKQETRNEAKITLLKIFQLADDESVIIKHPCRFLKFASQNMRSYYALTFFTIVTLLLFSSEATCLPSSIIIRQAQKRHAAGSAHSKPTTSKKDDGGPGTNLCYWDPYCQGN